MYAIKVELKLNNREKTLMNKHLGFSRFCYNYALSIYNQLNHKEYPGGSSKKIDLIRKIFNNLTKKNPDFDWANQMSSRVYQNAFRNLKTAFTKFWKGEAKRPIYKKKKHPGSFKDKLGLTERTYDCNACSLSICRDLNSAINLAQAPLEQTKTRVGSIRRNACGQVVADNLGLKQEVNTKMINFG